jgi:biotin operon repressor
MMQYQKIEKNITGREWGSTIESVAKNGYLNHI